MVQSQKQAQHVTGVSNVAYDLMAVLYNTLEGVAALEEYKLDAEEQGDNEAGALFEELQQHQNQMVDRLYRMLAQRL